MCRLLRVRDQQVCDDDVRQIWRRQDWLDLEILVAVVVDCHVHWEQSKSPWLVHSKVYRMFVCMYKIGGVSKTLLDPMDRLLLNTKSGNLLPLILRGIKNPSFHTK